MSTHRRRRCQCTRAANVNAQVPQMSLRKCRRCQRTGAGDVTAQVPQMSLHMRRRCHYTGAANVNAQMPEMSALVSAVVRARTSRSPAQVMSSRERNEAFRAPQQAVGGLCCVSLRLMAYHVARQVRQAGGNVIRCDG